MRSTGAVLPDVTGGTTGGCRWSSRGRDPPLVAAEPERSTADPDQTGADHQRVIHLVRGVG